MTLRAISLASITAGCVIPALIFMVGCSRSEKPDADVKKERVIEIAPTAVPATSNVQAVGVERKSNTNSPHDRPSRRVVNSTPEDKKALRERQKAFAREVAGKELGRMRSVYEQELQELDRKEGEAREKDPRVKDAYATVLQARAEYEEACVKSLPDYERQLNEAAMVRARLEDLVARRNKGEWVDTNELVAVYRNLNEITLKISQIRDQATAETGSVALALHRVVKVQAEYEQVLLGNNEYAQAKVKSDGTLAEITRLTHIQENNE